MCENDLDQLPLEILRLYRSQKMLLYAKIVVKYVTRGFSHCRF